MGMRRLETPLRGSLTGRLLVCMLLGVLAGMSGSCTFHRHVVGGGPNGVGTDSLRQYYVFFGLLRLNEADSQRLTQDSTSYEIVTEFSLVDLLLTPILLPLSVTTRTVTVNR